MTVKFHFAPKPRRTVSCAWLGCSNRNYESFAPVLWVFEDYKCEAFVGYDVLYIVSGSVPSCPYEKTWLQIRITFLKDKDKGTQSDLRRSHSRGQILLGRTYLCCLEPGALVLLDSCDAAQSCKLFSKSSLTGSLISQYPLNEKIAAEPLASDGGSPIMVSEPFVHPLTAFGIGRLCFVYQNLDSSL